MSVPQIRDGPDADAPLLHTASGTSIPAVTLSTGNVAHITFTTDGTMVNKGFLLKWTTETGILIVIPHWKFHIPELVLFRSITWLYYPLSKGDK